MIYDVNSPLFRSFLSQKGGASDKRIFDYVELRFGAGGFVKGHRSNETIVLVVRKTEEQRPKEQRPKANENKPVMTD
ncbi:unnamed protein product [Lupinus luteus]|uniref:Uncharacterized protein n=1 Tax=Lupinus luteus TaxID=3873 RepID=A0AAV1W6R0_LUPLU